MRTVENFVREMVERGRTKEQIHNVAAAGRWNDKMEEVAAECDRQFQTKQAA
jgi:hypothetical protein